jgi:uncharacterized protein (TIGR00730 family)
LGHLLAVRSIGLVYGGGNVGLMGVLADAMLEKGGTVTGVIPDFLLQKEVGHRGLSELIVVETMHERKAIMADRADSFMALPGGFGTLDELCEILTWSQLGLHRHPVGLLNLNGYFDGLIAFFDHMTQQGFLHQKNREILLVHEDTERLLQLMDHYQPPQVEKWLDREDV